MAYNFELLSENGSPEHIRATVEESKAAMRDGWPCWAISNHDVQRVISRWCCDARDPIRATQLTAVICSLRGTVCVFQGEELGLGEAEVPFEALRDPFGIEFWPTFKGRDGCRTPMPWTRSENAGFSNGTPWLPVSPSHQALAVSEQERDPHSSLNMFRHFMSWRKTHEALKSGDIEFLMTTATVLAFTRRTNDERILVAFNLCERPVTMDLPEAFHGKPLGGHGLPEGALTGKKLSLPAHGALFFLLA